jgi:hypothetical protein
VIAQLGNLILVDQPLNTELGNKSFADKKRILAKSKAWVDPIIQNAESWDEDDIKKRTQKIENPNSRVGGCCLLEFTLISVVHHKPHSTSFYDV